MSDFGEEQRNPERSGGENEGVREDVESQGGEGSRTAQTTPPIGDDAKKGQTQSPAPPDDAGVPPDEELGRDQS
jgi:hypothetical protein